MNINTILLGLREVTGLEVEPDAYTGSAPEYITFHYADERTELYADDRPIADTAYIQVHLFTPGNYMIKKRIIRDYLEEKGFTGVSIQSLYESETKLHHIVFECEWTEEREE